MIFAPVTVDLTFPCRLFNLTDISLSLILCSEDICQLFSIITLHFIVQELTSSAGEDVVFAMNTFIKRLLAVSDPSQMKVCFFSIMISFLVFSLHPIINVDFDPLPSVKVI